MRDNPYKRLPPLERKQNGFLYRMTPAQRKQANALIRRECCCYDSGNCIALDDGDILRRHFSYEDYRIFMLRFYETGSSFRTIARHMGEKTSVVTRRAQAMMESVRANRKFIARRRLIMAGEAA